MLEPQKLIGNAQVKIGRAVHQLLDLVRKCHSFTREIAVFSSKFLHSSRANGAVFTSTSLHFMPTLPMRNWDVTSTASSSLHLKNCLASPGFKNPAKSPRSNIPVKIS